MWFFLLQTKWQKPSTETVITSAATHWCDKKADGLTERHEIHFNYTLNSESVYQYYVIASRFKQSKVKRYFDQFCQIWDDYMWVTPEKGQLVMIADICWEQDVHTIGYNNQMTDKKNLKPMGFLRTKQCYKTCKVTYDPNQSPQCLGGTGDSTPESGGLPLIALPVAMAAPRMDRKMYGRSGLCPWKH